MENIIENYNADSIGLALINLQPNILKVLKCASNSPLFNEVCKDSDELEEIVFGSTAEEEEKPLLSRKRSSQRRKSSVKSNRLSGNERKLSAYDLE